ncbi:MAG: alpha/beta hydrolase [Bacteroidetes bacterium]|nr:alpha/beta hydrolase [Bacteroidota bacterium]
MKTITLFVILVCCSASLSAQQAATTSADLVGLAQSLYMSGDFKGSAFAYADAFKAKGGKATANKHYNAACSWALAGYPDSAFANLLFIANHMNYANFGHMKSDPDLVSLAADARWAPLLETVMANRKQSFPGLEMLTVNRHQLEVVISGRENAQNGKPVIVFENGRGTDLAYWLPIIREVSKEQVAFAYNRPRIGCSEDDNQVPTIDHIVEVLRQALRAKGLEPPYLFVGHSWGAAYIRCYASFYPDEVAGLIFVDPHDFVKKPGGGSLPYREIGLTQSQIDSLFASYDKSADEYMAQGPAFVVEEMKAQRAFSKTGYNLIARNPLPDVPVHFIMAGGYPAGASENEALYDHEKLFRINNNIMMKSWIALIDPLSYGKFFYCSHSGHMVQQDDPDIIIASIKLALSDYRKIVKEKPSGQ